MQIEKLTYIGETPQRATPREIFAGTSYVVRSEYARRD